MIVVKSMSFIFFFNDTATTEIYTSFPTRRSSDLLWEPGALSSSDLPPRLPRLLLLDGADELLAYESDPRSEEHTSELQSRQYLVCRLLLEKKKHQHFPRV